MATTSHHAAVLIFIILVQLTGLQLAMGLSLTAIPPIFTEESTGQVLLQLSCMPDIVDHRQRKDVIMLEIGREGKKSMAFVRQGSGVSYGGAAIANSYKAIGQVDKGNGNTFLNVTFHNPKKDDSGRYVCKMYFIDVSGVFSEQSVTTNLTVEIFNIHTTVMSLIETVVELKSEVQNSRNRVIQLEEEADRSKKRVFELEADMNHEVSKVSTQMDSWANRTVKLEDQTRNHIFELTEMEHRDLELHDKINRLSNTTDKLAKRTDNLEDRVSYVSAFSASLKERIRPSNGDVIVFTETIMNVGEGYNNKTGIFTAPRAGIYVFHLTLKTEIDCCDGWVNLEVNSKVVSIVFVHVKERAISDQSSVSSVVALEVGDEVKAVVADHLYWDKGMYSTFTGYIIRAF